MDRTIGDALNSARSRLSAISTAEADAVELLSRLLGLSRSELLLRRHEPMVPEQWKRLDSWLARRAAGQPVQYITGRAAFRFLDLAVGPAVLVPRPETEQVVEAVLDVLREELMHWVSPRILDLGTGSGAIALSLAREWPQAIVTATDASAAALATALTNAVALGLDERVQFREGYWFDAVGGEDRFEVVVSNPPYIGTDEADELPPDVRDHEPHEALFSGESGLEALRAIVEEAPRHLVAGGLLALELAEMRAREVAGWLEGAHDWSGVDLRDDFAGRPRILLARREKGPAIAPAQWEEER
ncbi:MAG: peptide chain release factor N(5)-glutamine methyltransferase [Candidatus Eisenbacteria bacterium]